MSWCMTMNNQSESTILRYCKCCKKEITHKHKNAKFCCLECKDDYHNYFNPRGYGLRDLDDDPSWDAHKNY